jgi:hypothetical protein
LAIFSRLCFLMCFAILFSFSFLFSGTGGLTFSRQALFYLTNSTSLFWVDFFFFFLERVSHYAQANLDCNPSICASQLNGFAGTYPYAQPVFEMGSHELLLMLTLNCCPPHLCLPCR